MAMALILRQHSAVLFDKARAYWLSVSLVVVGLLFFALPCIGAASAGAEQRSFPIPLSRYPASEGLPVVQVLLQRMRVEPFNLIATLLFFGAIFHTFLAPRFIARAHYYEGLLHDLPKTVPNRRRLRFKAEMFDLLGEVEAVFGIWVVPLLLAISFEKGWPTARDYIGQGLNFTEPMFVMVIMTIAASRPILALSENLVSVAAGLGRRTPAAWWLSILSVGPVLGSCITEPAAMTISALLLAAKFYEYRPSYRLAYATLGLLFVNVSVGGTLTHFAAPPVLMVAGKWGWGFTHMITHFGWKAVVGMLSANLFYYLIFRKELRALAGKAITPQLETAPKPSIPPWMTGVHIFFLAWTVSNNHYPALFIGGFLFYLAFTRATDEFQDELALRPAMLVGFFLAGLVIHGGLQGWWIGPVLSSLSQLPLYFGAICLTAFNDNAAITYLASLVPNFSPEMQYSVVAGAVVGGGLTVIANAPNPAGQSILSRFFPEGVSPLYLFVGALVPTLIVGTVFLVFA